MSKFYMDNKRARIISDIPDDAYQVIKLECVKRKIAIGTIVKLAVREYLELDLTMEQLGIDITNMEVD